MSVVVEMSLFFNAFLCTAQTPSQTAQPRTSEEALLVARRAISALGSEAAWNEISSIRSTATITSNAGPTRTIIWADNWSTGTLKYKRAPKAADGNSAAGAPIIHSAKVNGKAVTIPKQSDSTMLTVSAPAEALLRGMNNGRCAYYPENDNRLDPYSIQNVPQGQLAFVQACPAMTRNYGALHWRVDASTFLPVSVSIPEHAFRSASIIYTLVKFESFTSVGEVLVPDKILLTSNSSIYKQIQFSGIATSQASAATSK